jgi:predicted metal-dependent hydrolase
MRETTQFANYHVEIWRRPRQRHMHLTVRPDGRVRVTCHKRVSKRAILAFVMESREFIERRNVELADLQKKFPPKQMLSGEPYLFLGRRLQLQVVWTWTDRIQVVLRDEELEMTAPLSSTAEERAKAMRMFFKKTARRHLEERVKVLGGLMSLSPQQLTIRAQSTRWGSYSSRGEMSLNMKLICCPEWVIDYVVVHELAHITFMNHSADFWGLVQPYAPNHRAARDWLRAHQAEIAVQFEGRRSP